MKSAKMIGEIINIVHYSFNRNIDKEGIHYARFVTHTKYFVERLLSGNMLSDDDNLYDKFCDENEDCLRIAEKVDKFILNKYKLQITYEEKIFMAIHINRIKMNRTKGN